MRDKTAPLRISGARFGFGRHATGFGFVVRARIGFDRAREDGWFSRATL
jgi:hypothetical protein